MVPMIIRPIIAVRHAPASDRTEVRVLYDSRAIYIAVRASASLPLSAYSVTKALPPSSSTSQDTSA